MPPRNTVPQTLYMALNVHEAFTRYPFTYCSAFGYLKKKISRNTEQYDHGKFLTPFLRSPFFCYVLGFMFFLSCTGWFKVVPFPMSLSKSRRR